MNPQKLAAALRLVADALEDDQATADLVDQHASEAGPRRFIAAIRSGRLAGSRVGRRWLAKRADHDAWLSSLGSKPAPKKAEPATSSDRLLDRLRKVS